MDSCQGLNRRFQASAVGDVSEFRHLYPRIEQCLTKAHQRPSLREREQQPDTWSLFSREHDEVIARRGEWFALEAAVDCLYLEARELQHEI